jgi:hypothetical protein
MSCGSALAATLARPTPRSSSPIRSFTAYRQHLDELEVNPQDDRMIPDLFEAYALRGTLVTA